MQVSFNPSVNSANFKGAFFKKKKSPDTYPAKPLTKDEIQESKTKMVLSYARYIVLLIGVLYFAVKKSVKDAESAAEIIQKNKVDSIPMPAPASRLA